MGMDVWPIASSDLSGPNRNFLFLGSVSHALFAAGMDAAGDDDADYCIREEETVLSGEA